MSDVVTGIAVLDRPRGRLAVWCGQYEFIGIDVAPGPQSPGSRVWTYLEGDGRLHLKPSLLVNGGTVAEFHTAYDWSVPFVELPAGADLYDYHQQLNAAGGPR